MNESQNRHDGDRLVIETRRAGALYEISGTAAKILGSHASTELAAKLTTWVIEQHQSGIIVPLINSKILEDVERRPSYGISEQIQGFFFLLRSRKFRVDSYFPCEESPVKWTLRDEDRDDLCAWTQCQTVPELYALIDLMIKAGLISHTDRTIRLALKGLERLDAISMARKDSRQAFVAMWFDSSMDDAFSEGFSKAITEAGYKPIRIDKKEHNNKIDDEIIAEIRRSKFVVADFTCQLFGTDTERSATPRGGVYFEAGFAMGLGTPVIWSCREDMIEHVHFDTRQFSHVLWNTPDELYSRLLNRIRAVIDSAA